MGDSGERGRLLGKDCMVWNDDEFVSISIMVGERCTIIESLAAMSALSFGAFIS